MGEKAKGKLIRWPRHLQMARGLRLDWHSHWQRHLLTLRHSRLQTVTRTHLDWLKHWRWQTRMPMPMRLRWDSGLPTDSLMPMQRRMHWVTEKH